MAANKILPEVGASTCALGSQKCNLKKGNFTKNGNKNKQKNQELKYRVWFINNESQYQKIIIIITKKGRLNKNL